MDDFISIHGEPNNKTTHSELGDTPAMYQPDPSNNTTTVTTGTAISQAIHCGNTYGIDYALNGLCEQKDDFSFFDFETIDHFDAVRSGSGVSLVDETRRNTFIGASQGDHLNNSNSTRLQASTQPTIINVSKHEPTDDTISPVSTFPSKANIWNLNTSVFVSSAHTLSTKSATNFYAHHKQYYNATNQLSHLTPAISYPENCTYPQNSSLSTGTANKQCESIGRCNFTSYHIPPASRGNNDTAIYPTAGNMFHIRHQTITNQQTEIINNSSLTQSHPPSLYSQPFYSNKFSTPSSCSTTQSSSAFYTPQSCVNTYHTLKHLPTNRDPMPDAAQCNVSQYSQAMLPNIHPAQTNNQPVILNQGAEDFCRLASADSGIISDLNSPPCTMFDEVPTTTTRSPGVSQHQFNINNNSDNNHSKSTSSYSDCHRRNTTDDTLSNASQGHSQGETSLPLHSILNPSRSPDTITSLDITTAIDYILKKCPPVDMFPRAKDIFDSSYKTLRASKLTFDRKKKPDILQDELTQPPASPFVSYTESCGPSGNTASSIKTKVTKRRPSVLPPCRICGCLASGLHYGVITCEACNGFFRRSLRRGSVYFCSKDGHCDVIGKRRGECSYCRYNKCLAIGMSKTAVKTGRYSDKTRMAYAMETENHKKGSNSDNDSFDTRLSPIDDRCEQTQSNAPCHMSPEMRPSKHEHRSPVNNIPVDEYPMCSHRDVDIIQLAGPGTSMTSVMASFLETWLCYMVKFVKLVPGLALLDLRDQTTLVRSRWKEIWLLSAYRARSSSGCQHPEDKTSIVYYNEEKVVFGKSYADLCDVWCEKLSKQDISQTENILMMMICLTCPDGCSLRRPLQARMLHWLMRQALSKYMGKHRVGASHAFNKALSATLSVSSAVGDHLLPFSRDHLAEAGRPGTNTDGTTMVSDTPLLTEMLMMSPSRSPGQGQG